MESTQNDGMRAVDPIKPVAAYQGGKRNLARRLCEIIEATPHTLYAEPFVGMGGVFLRRKSKPRAEAINDISKDVTGLFRILQHHYVPFMDMLRYQITSRAEFETLNRVDPDTLTDLQRAARFLYLQKTAFGGKISVRNFGVSVDRPARFDVTKLQPMLEDLHDRLASVTIECLPYASFIKRYDRPNTLFYLDPPYWNGETDYGEGVFARGDFRKLAELLSGIQGQFILSINDTPEIRELFKWAAIEEAQHNYSIGSSSSKKASELIITRVLNRTSPALP